MENKMKALQKRFDDFQIQIKYKNIESDGIACRYMDIGNPNGKPLLFLTKQDEIRLLRTIFH